MAKDAGKKVIGKKSIKEVKKTSKAVAQVKAPSKGKEANSVKESKSGKVLKTIKTVKEQKPSKEIKNIKAAKSVKLEKLIKLADKEIVKKEKSAKKEVDVKTPSLLSKIAGKIFKSEQKPKESEIQVAKKDSPASKIMTKVNKLETIAKIKEVSASKKEKKEVREKAVQVDVADTEGERILVKETVPALKKQSKKAQAAYKAATEEEAKWLELKDKYKGIHPCPYKMSEIYQEKTLLDHKVLGLGVILSVVNDRLEVLFQTGMKHLISNYKK